MKYLNHREEFKFKFKNNSNENNLMLKIKIYELNYLHYPFMYFVYLESHSTRSPTCMNDWLPNAIDLYPDFLYDII